MCEMCIIQNALTEVMALLWQLSTHIAVEQASDYLKAGLLKVVLKAAINMHRTLVFLGNVHTLSTYAL